ncbi:MAG: threonine synthase [Clostridia bacterium]|nr:threonine synthase [Clostridia bacterium]
MKYQSTRNKGVSVSAAQAINNGISPEGGLYVPASIPQISLEDIASLAELKYADRAAKILGMFLSDYTPDELSYCAHNAYSEEKFGSDNTAPVCSLDDTLNILELWHGPTCAFKDMALQILPYLLKLAIGKNGENNEVVILVATSGDTGKAALEGFRDVEGTRIQVFYPVDGVSDIQKLQMTTQDGKNVSVCAVNGNFDDAQTGVKKIFTNEEYKKELNLRGYTFSSANSINWGRLAPQIVYYFSAYCDLLKNDKINNGDKINIVVPTGNFGNILAAYYALQMGLPVNKLICASNSNNVLTDFINTGVYDRNRTFYTTASPSMDILISSNLERLLFHMTGRNDETIRGYMSELEVNGKYTVSDDVKSKIQEIFVAGCCDDAATSQTIAKYFNKYSYVVDTHTAVALNVYEKYVENTGDTTTTVVASTANPFKFNEAVISAISPETSLDGKDEFELLEILAQKGNIEIPAQLSELKTKAVRFKDVCNKEDMRVQTDKFLN